MIDIESYVFSKVKQEAIKVFPKLSMKGEEIRVPSEIPCASLEEIDNVSYDKTADSSSNENHAEVTYELSVYSNKTSGKKSECKKIFALIDGLMLDMGFSRIMKKPQPIEDSSVYRLIGRYRGVVDKDKNIYRR